LSNPANFTLLTRASLFYAARCKTWWQLELPTCKKSAEFWAIAVTHHPFVVAMILFREFLAE